MSHQATTWVMEFSESRLSHRLVLGAIAHRVSNDNGEAFPSVSTIARESRLSESAVHASLGRLRQMGELEIEVGTSEYGTNIYRMPKFLSWYLTLHAAERGPKPVPRKRRFRTPGVQSTLEMTPESAPEPSVGTINKPSKPPAASQPGDPRHQPFIEFASEAYRTRFGQHPTWSGKDFRNVSDLLGRAPHLAAEELCRRFTNYLASTDPFITRNGYSLAIFCMRFDALCNGPIIQQGGKTSGNGKINADERTRNNLAAAGFPVD